MKQELLNNESIRDKSLSHYMEMTEIVKLLHQLIFFSSLSTEFMVCSLLGVLNMILLDGYQPRNVSSDIRMTDC